MFRQRRLETFRSAFCAKSGWPLSILFWCAVAGIWGGLNGWLYRDFMNPDGVSYLDLAREGLKHGPLALVNAHWGALYPGLIALLNLLLPPSPEWEFAYVHGLNAVIYFAAAVAFGFFLRELILFRVSERGPLWKQGAFIAFGFALFFCYSNGDIIPLAVTPDMLLAAIAFAAAAFFLRILREADKRGSYVALGCVLAAGYYTKSIMLPAGAVLLGILFICRYRSRSHLRNILIAGAIMFLVCAPQIAMISSRVGHFSIGETGRLNYLWWVQRIRQFEGWTGTPGGDVPVHGPRLVMSDPEVLEFGQPIGGSYPLWYDPAYWYAGARPRFDLHKQWAALRLDLDFYKYCFADLCFPLAGLIVLIILAIVARTRLNKVECWLALWPLTLLLIYTGLIIEYRYAAPWLILFWVAAYSALLARNGKIERLLLVSLALIIILPRLGDLKEAYSTMSKVRGPSMNVRVARELKQMGLHNGDAIATVGEGFSHHYAHIANVRIVTQVTNEADFWSLSPDRAIAVEHALAGTGAKVLLGRGRPDIFQSTNWRVVAETPYSMLSLDKTPSP